MPSVRRDLRPLSLWVFGVFCLVLCLATPAYAQSDTAQLATSPTDKEILLALDSVKQVAKDGVGNEGAAAAMPTLNRATPAQIPMLLEAFNGSSALQRNWLMSGVSRANQRRQSDWPKKAVEDYFIDHDNDSYGRLVAFELMTQNNQALKKQLIPELINDPSLPLRHKAIADLIDKAKKLDGDENNLAAIALLNKALDNALDVGQIESIAKQLRAKDSPVNLLQVMGFLDTWQIVAGFDNTDSKGFGVAHGPELDLAKVDLNAVYEDAAGKPVRWREFETKSDKGVFDLNRLIGRDKDRIGYAYAVFDSPIQGPAEIRLGSPNANKIWLNGNLVMTNEIYHNSNAIDKFVSNVNLVRGPNRILIKLCQNNQTQPWAQDWQFQLRFCDESSKPILPLSP